MCVGAGGFVYRPHMPSLSDKRLDGLLRCDCLRKRGGGFWASLPGGDGPAAGVLSDVALRVVWVFIARHWLHGFLDLEGFWSCDGVLL